MKRQRGRGRKPGGNPGNRSHESNGPEVKIRGTAAQIHEKYVQYARDAQSSGDRVRFENLMQHAEHYFRILAATMPKDRLPGMQPDGSQRHGSDDDMDEGNDSGQASDDADDNDREESEETVEASAPPSGDESGEGANRPRRRRGRRRPSDGERSESGGDEGDTEAKSAAKSAIDALAKKQAAVAGG